MGIRRYVLATAIVAWLGVVGLGVQTIHAYAARPGSRSATPRRWPQASELRHGGVTVAMFVHPACPCTRASITELARALRGARGQVTVEIVSSEPLTDELRARFTAIPTAHLRFDRDGREAARFGALTSGHVVAYDVTGRLAFSGGITPARGHEGANMGERSLAQLLAGAAPTVATRGVFGCGLHGNVAPR